MSALRPAAGAASATTAARAPRGALLLVLVLLLLAALALLAAPSAAAAGTEGLAPGAGPGVSVQVEGADGQPSSALVILLGITVLSVAPALLLMMTSFTKIFVVLSITRNALGLTAAPPNQVLAGLALFLSLFVMAPVLSQVNDLGVQPFLAGDLDQTQALSAGVAPLKEFMLGHVRPDDLALVTRAADRPNPETRADTPLLTLIPAFVLSELRAAFIIGFVIYVPFLVIDLVVSAALMSMGMMMLPPVTVSLPFKLLLFVLVDGWGLVITAVIGTYTGAGGGG
ncbi:flagellar type III secretion system pore protein FliP [Pseudokineococcus sp. 1T1Z-3]|uniref:flagellar type III secretion system pore protein FliP n=1 Tax=Pseudokineococcus sp. 1T1Z-3 TaxID=3132745 RepID=UPI0030A0A1C5